MRVGSNIFEVLYQSKLSVALENGGVLLLFPDPINQLFGEIEGKKYDQHRNYFHIRSDKRGDEISHKWLISENSCMFFARLYFVLFITTPTKP